MYIKLLFMFLMIILMLLCWMGGITFLNKKSPILGIILIILAVIFFILFIVFINNVNEAHVLTLFGKYIGTVKKTGYCFVNPFAVHKTNQGIQ